MCIRDSIKALQAHIYGVGAAQDGSTQLCLAPGPVSYTHLGVEKSTAAALLQQCDGGEEIC